MCDSYENIAQMADLAAARARSRVGRTSKNAPRPASLTSTRCGLSESLPARLVMYTRG